MLFSFMVAKKNDFLNYLSRTTVCYLLLFYGREKKIHPNGSARNYPICLCSQTLPFSAVPVKGMYLTDLLSTSQNKFLFSLACETCSLIL